MNKTYLYFLDRRFDLQNQLIFKVLKFIFVIIWKISLTLSTTESNCFDARSQGILVTMFEEDINDEIN